MSNTPTNTGGSELSTLLPLVQWWSSLGPRSGQCGLSPPGPSRAHSSALPQDMPLAEGRLPHSGGRAPAGHGGMSVAGGVRAAPEGGARRGPSISSSRSAAPQPRPAPSQQLLEPVGRAQKGSPWATEAAFVRANAPPQALGVSTLIGKARSQGAMRMSDDVHVVSARVQLVVRSDRLLSSPASSSSRMDSRPESAEGSLCGPERVQKHFCRPEGSLVSN